jgi:hypothetical protein
MEWFGMKEKPTVFPPRAPAMRNSAFSSSVYNMRSVLLFGKTAFQKKYNHSIDTVVMLEDTALRDFFVNCEHTPNDSGERPAIGGLRSHVDPQAILGATMSGFWLAGCALVVVVLAFVTRLLIAVVAAALALLVFLRRLAANKVADFTQEVRDQAGLPADVPLSNFLRAGDERHRTLDRL